MLLYNNRLNPNLGGIFRGLFWGGTTPHPYPCLKLVKIMLEASNLARKYTDVSIFCKKLAIFVQKSTFTQSNRVRAVLEIF